MTNVSAVQLQGGDHLDDRMGSVPRAQESIHVGDQGDGRAQNLATQMGLRRIGWSKSCQQRKGIETATTEYIQERLYVQRARLQPNLPTRRPSALRRPLGPTAIASECFFSNCLEGDDTNTSRLGNDAASGGSRVNSVLVAGSPGALLGDLSGGVGEDVVALGGEALQVRVEVGDNGPLDTGEGVALNENLSTHAGVDTGDTAVVAGAVDVGGSEADRGETGVDVLEVVVVVGDAQLALVGLSVVGVAHQGTLPLLQC